MPVKAKTYAQRGQQPTAEDNRPTAQQRGYDHAWKKFRAWFIKQPGNQICVFVDHPAHKHECTVAVDVIDHIQPLRLGGAKLDPSNCRGVCRQAHARLTNSLTTTGKNVMPEPNHERP